MIGVASRILLVLVLSATAAVAARVADTDASNPLGCGVVTSLSPDGLLVATWSGTCRYDSWPLTDIQVAWSGDQGATWTSPLTLGTGGVPLVVASGAGRIDVAWASALSANAPVMRRSTDAGLTWGPERSLPVPELKAVLVSLAVSDTGDIALVTTNTPYRGRLAVSSSTDGGVTFQSGQTMARPGLDPRYPAATWMGGQNLLVCWSGWWNAWLGECSASADGGLTFAASVGTGGGGGFNAVATRGPGDVLLLSNDVIVRTTDFGQTWSPPAYVGQFASGDIDARYFGWPSLATASGEVWAATAQPPEDNWSDNDYYRNLARVRVHHSIDGLAWQPVSSPPDLAGCLEAGSEANQVVPYDIPWRRRIHAAGTGVALLADSRYLWRSRDVGATWSAPVTVVPPVEPVHDAKVTEIAGGRLLAVWLHRGATPHELLSSLSLDRGATWSPPATIADRTVSLRHRLNYHFSRAVPPPPHRVSVVGTAAGPVWALWLACTGADCAELRASRSVDGLTWEPSIRLGRTTGLPYSIAEDISGVLVAVWLDDDLVSSNSSDGGLSWSPPLVIQSMIPGMAAMGSSAIVAAADGSLVVLGHDQTWGGDCPLGAFRTTDGGLNWSGHGIASGWFTSPPDLVSAGPRLVASSGEYWGHGPPVDQDYFDYESFDFGVTWVPFVETKADRTIPTTSRLVGDPAGNVYWVSGDRRKVGRLNRAIDDLGPAPKATYERSLVALGPDETGFFFADWSRPSPGVFFTSCTGSLAVGPSPQSRRRCVGDSTTFSFSASGTGLRYQWYRNGAPIPGATSSDYNIFSITPAHDGSYVCAVTSDCDSKSSTPALLEVDEGPVVTSSPPSRSVRFGRPTSFRVTVSGYPPLGYQWSKDGLPIPGATSPLYRIGAVDFADAGWYACTITGPCGVTSSPPAELIVTPWPGR